MEFFDNEKNWNKNKVATGREWKTDELRIKSNEDLHKLWYDFSLRNNFLSTCFCIYLLQYLMNRYVLLKERNMLITMEDACNDAYELFPSPERIDKVEMSMKNLETVVRERNEAYYKLETGESGEQPSVYVFNCFGMQIYIYRIIIFLLWNSL